MKKILFFGVLLCYSVLAMAEGRVYVYGEPGDYYFGMLNRVSDNGRWAVGADDGYQTGSYIIDTTNPEALTHVKDGEMYDVTDDGMVVGSWYENQGTASEPIYYAHAAFYKNGVWTQLPEPTSCVGRSYARCVSTDGRYIAGMAFCHAKDSEMGGKYYPCVWTLGSDGKYTVQVHNDIVLPGNMGFYVNDMTPDARTLVGSVCTDAGGTVPAMLQDGKLVVWNKMEWKERAFDVAGQTEYYDAGFVDDVLEGATEDGWFYGGFNYVNGDYVFGHRTVTTDVNVDKATGTLTHYRTVYNLKTGEFIDEPGQSSYSCGYDERNTFIVSGLTGYYKNGGMMRKPTRMFNLSSPVDIAVVYGGDAEGRVFACSMVWFNEVIGEYCESPALMIMDKSLKDGAVVEPSMPTQTGSAKSFTLSPTNSSDLSQLSGLITVTFSSSTNMRVVGGHIQSADGKNKYPITIGDKPNEVKCHVTTPITESGEYTFVIPQCTLVNDDTNQWMPEMRFTYTVDASLANGGGWEVTPSLDQPIKQLDGTYTITLTNYASIVWDSMVRPCRVFIYRDGSDTSMRPLAYYDATVHANTITFTAKPGLYEAGNYFINISGFVNGADDTDIDDINIPFTLTGGTPPDEPDDPKPVLDQTYILAPDNHAPLPELSGRIVITFPGVSSFADIGGFPTLTTPSGEKYGVFADGTVLRIKSYDQYDGGDYIRNAGYIDLDAVGLRFTDPGEYTISIPKNVFHVDGDYDKDYADPFEIKYTVGYPSTVLFEENFDNNYGENFPWCLDGDGMEPASDIRALFLSAEHGYYMPWWVLRESSTDPDRFMGSHSHYSTPGQSDDWMVSRPITIPTEGYILQFDAQSVLVRNDNRLSDLSLFITETLVTDSWRPKTPTAVYENVPCGATPDVTTGEWTRYELPLDTWVGKTIHLCFANLNNDRDLLCINNVRVFRHEPVEVEFGALPTVTADETVTVSATVTAVAEDLNDYEAIFVCRGATINTVEGTEPIRQGESRTFTATVNLEPRVPTTIVFRLTPRDGATIERAGSITRLAFRTNHRVLIEETTGLWCGNCPIGIYNIESLKEDESICDNVLPVSVHITGATTDLMANDMTNAYAEYLGIGNVAPMTRIDRGPNAVGFSTIYDTKYSPTTDHSFANLVHTQRNQPSLFDIEVDAVPVVNGTDTVAFRCTASVKPALDLDADRYRVGFILTENNVGLDGKSYWAQHNYFSAYPFESQLGGWTELPSTVQDLRYHYVARALPNPGGIEGSFTELKAEQEYTVSGLLTIPNTYQTDRNGNLASLAVRPYMCEVTAYIVDIKDLSVQNSARIPVTDQALDLYTLFDYLANGVTLPHSDTDNHDIYDLHGRRVNDVSYPGLYIRGNKKVMVR